MARDWSRLEVEATVADYFDMLASELRGEPYNKSEHRRNLKPLLDGRSESAIERKHQNISAILLELGVRPILGYKPLSNYQGLLYDVVAERVAGESDLLRLVEEEVEAPQEEVPEVEDILARLEDPPESSGPPDRVVERAGGGGRRNPDYLAREARNASLGRAGELFVVRFERARLLHLGRDKLADRVEHVAVTVGDGEGFDVLSFEADGSDRFIEVKTTRYAKETPFYLSSNELRVSEERSDRYHLYRPFRFRDDPRLFTVKGSLNRTCHLTATEFRARIA